MVSNFEILMDFKNVRDFAICMSKNNICCHKMDSMACIATHSSELIEDACRKCWLDFLTSDERLDLSYLDKVEPFESKTSPIRLSKKSMQILKEKEKSESFCN